MCMFDKFHLTSNFKSKVPHDVFKNKSAWWLRCIVYSKLSPQCHMSSSTSHFKFWSVNWRVVFFGHKSHYMSKSKLCMSINMRFNYVQVFACQMSKTSKNFVKHTHWWAGCLAWPGSRNGHCLTKKYVGKRLWTSLKNFIYNLLDHNTLLRCY